MGRPIFPEGRQGLKRNASRYKDAPRGIDIADQSVENGNGHLMKGPVSISDGKGRLVGCKLPGQPDEGIHGNPGLF
jgi:hypothetical protein